MGSIGIGVQADFGDPCLDDSGVLPRRQMRGEPQPTREQIILGPEGRMTNPGEDRFAGRLRDLKLNRPLGFLLHGDRARSDPITVGDITDAQLQEIAAAQL